MKTRIAIVLAFTLSACDGDPSEQTATQASAETADASADAVLLKLEPKTPRLASAKANLNSAEAIGAKYNAAGGAGGSAQ